MKNIKLLSLLTLVALFCTTGAALGADITVKVTGFKNEKGTALVYLWTGQAGFPSDPSKAVQTKNVPIKDSAVTVTFSADPGTYAVSVTHDENGNGKMDTGFMGKPKEGYGASNNPQNKMSAPSFDQCKFTLDASGKTVDIKIR